MVKERQVYSWGYKNLGNGLQSMEEKFKVDIEKLRVEQISVLKAIYREGIKHISYYHKSMAAFRNPELRVKTFDTKYYEEVLPIIIDIFQNNYPKIYEDLTKEK